MDAAIGSHWRFRKLLWYTHVLFGEHHRPWAAGRAGREACLGDCCRNEGNEALATAGKPERKTKEVREDEQGSAPATSMLYPPLPSTASGCFRTEQGMETAGHTDHLPDVVLSEKSCITGHATVVPLKLCPLFGETRSKKTSGGDWTWTARRGEAGGIMHLPPKSTSQYLDPWLCYLTWPGGLCRVVKLETLWWEILDCPVCVWERGPQCNHKLPYRQEMGVGESEAKNKERHEGRGESNVIDGWGQEPGNMGSL